MSVESEVIETAKGPDCDGQTRAMRHERHSKRITATKIKTQTRTKPPSTSSNAGQRGHAHFNFNQQHHPGAEFPIVSNNPGNPWPAKTSVPLRYESGRRRSNVTPEPDLAAQQSHRLTSDSRLAAAVPEQQRNGANKSRRLDCDRGRKRLLRRQPQTGKVSHKPRPTSL